MAKTTAPIMSFSARGSLAKTLVFAAWRGIKYARQHVIPANPNSTGQQTTRSTFTLTTLIWKVAGSLLTSPWSAFATGKPFLGRNAFIGQNVEALRGDADSQAFIGSPGAFGGLPPDSVAAAAGGASGEIDVTFTNPAAPTGWTLDAEVAVAFPDQDPALAFGGPLVEGESDPPTGTVTLTGLPANTLCVVSAWLRWVKPDGTIAYSASTTTTATSAV